jgi:chromosome partitioning protein
LSVRIVLEVWDTLIAKIVAGILTPILAGVIYLLLRRIYRAFRALYYAEDALRAVSRKQLENGLWAEGPGFWLKKPIEKPASYGDLQGNSIPIMMIGATKGGVGKTSLAGSLAAYFAMRWTQRREDPSADRPLRVLVIDQDFQGSFSTLTVNVDNRYVQPSKANRLVSGELADGGVRQEAAPITQDRMRPHLSIWTIPAYYDLAQAENRMLVEWLLPLSEYRFVAHLLRLFGVPETSSPRSRKDLRYLLAEALLHPQVQTSFDLIIIDSPPRLTPSHIQAMCASTHLLIPTILDGLAGDAVARYLDQVATHKRGPPGDSSRAICPHLQPIGVVCTLLPQDRTNLEGPVNVLRGRIAAAALRPDIVPEECFIRHRPPYRQHAGERIAYAAESEDAAHERLREEVDRLGDWIAPKLGAAPRGWRPR